MTKRDATSETQRMIHEFTRLTFQLRLTTYNNVITPPTRDRMARGRVSHRVYTSFAGKTRISTAAKSVVFGSRVRGRDQNIQRPRFVSARPTGFRRRATERMGGPG